MRSFIVDLSITSAEQGVFIGPVTALRSPITELGRRNALLVLALSKTGLADVVNGDEDIFPRTGSRYAPQIGSN